MIEDISKKDQEYIEYMIMLFENGVNKVMGLNFNKWKNENL